MSILVRRYLARSRSAEALVEEWQILYQKAQLAWDAQELVEECIELGQLAERAWEYLETKLFDETARFDHETAGQFMLLGLTKTLQVFRFIEKEVERLDRLDCPSLDNLEQFRAVVTRTQRIFEKFETQWPSADPDMIEEALAAYKRGECITSEALLNDAQGNGAKAD